MKITPSSYLKVRNHHASSISQHFCKYQLLSIVLMLQISRETLKSVMK